MDMYILKNRNAYRTRDIQMWGKWMATNNRSVALTEYDKVVVSTVFLGLDHNMMGRGPPLIFETMVFLNNSYSDPPHMERTPDFNAALEAHQRAVDRIDEFNALAKETQHG